MEHLLRPPSDSLFPAADALLNFPRCLQVLETAVRDVVIHFWEEPFRRRAHHLAQALSGGCRVCGFRESAGLVRSLESLLALTVDEVRGIQRSVADRMMEALALLREQALKPRSRESGGQDDPAPGQPAF
jgi:hypothetical protein